MKRLDIDETYCTVTIYSFKSMNFIIDPKQRPVGSACQRKGISVSWNEYVT